MTSPPRWVSAQGEYGDVSGW